VTDPAVTTRDRYGTVIADLVDDSPAMSSDQADMVVRAMREVTRRNPELSSLEGSARGGAHADHGRQVAALGS
jgi:hypothetical protein